MDLLDRPLALFYDAARARVLDVLLSSSDPMSGREVARRANLSPTTASAKLQDLEAAGLVTSQGDRRSHRWGLRADNALIDQLRQLARVQDEQAARMIMDALGAEPVSVVLFGSVARGESGADSDVDLLLVAADPDQDLHFRRRAYAVSRALRFILGRPVQVLVTYVEKVARDKDSAFVRAVLKDGRTLHGVTFRDLAS